LVYFLFGAGIYLGGFQFENRFYNFLPVFSNGEIYTSLDKTIYNAAGAVCLVLVVVNGFGKKFLESSIIKFLGEISFSIYLIHFIILCSASSFIYTLFPKTNVFVLLNFTIYIADCIFLSYLFMRFVDLPSIKLSKKFSNYILKK